ncbi:DUF6415 family natural product biosynthesis protein [Streptomyces pinistramenti]|uniref:DUF6415 family natural product biosynthesis protein n=1 Tax=Streptomyces pinistramenti TaxID=2884812 RepID=UPI001D05CD50|nr:DUF6415 family natural product biosynthesis protein [Streptomyces pinistramenti]MCB5908184.1 DUF6415 family natural product biosynthesis protein [Streptomyces pinistramenti]
MDTVQTQLTAPAPVGTDPVNTTIHQALRLRTGRPDIGMLAGLERELRAHIAHLLPDARESINRLRHGGVEAHRMATRLDAITHQTRQGLGPGPLSAHVQVQQLARDCQWLLTLARRTDDAS